MEVTINQLENLMYRYINKRKSFFVHGPPGIGKSQTGLKIAKKKADDLKLPLNVGSEKEGHYGFIDLRASYLDPSDLKGIPFPENNLTKWLKPERLPRKGYGLLFFDEINLAPPAVQSALYQLILDRRIDDYELPDGWSIIAAGNRMGDKSNVFAMSAALSNRFGHADLLPPSSEEWINWALKNNIRSNIIAFVAFKPTLLFKFDVASKDPAFPTHRSWAVASELTEGITDLEEEYMLVATQVGAGVAKEYLGFVELKDKINIDDILRDPKKVSEITELGLKYTLISGLAERYKQDTKKMDTILKVCHYLDNEFGIFLLRLMQGMNQTGFVKDLTVSKEWGTLYKKYGKFIY